MFASPYPFAYPLPYAGVESAAIATGPRPVPWAALSLANGLPASSAAQRLANGRAVASAVQRLPNGLAAAAAAVRLAP